MKVGDWIVPACVKPTDDYTYHKFMASEVIDDMRSVPWANCFRVRSVLEPEFIFMATERSHRVWKTLEERAEEALTK